MYILRQNNSKTIIFFVQVEKIPNILFTFSSQQKFFFYMMQKNQRKIISTFLFSPFQSFIITFSAGEVTGGYLSGSLAIMSDAAHMFSDFASFLVSLFAIHLGSKKSTRKFTYGLYRAEVLGALITVMIIWFVTGVLLFLACHRYVLMLETRDM